MDNPLRRKLCVRNMLAAAESFLQKLFWLLQNGEGRLDLHAKQQRTRLHHELRGDQPDGSLAGRGGRALRDRRGVPGCVR